MSDQPLEGADPYEIAMFELTEPQSQARRLATLGLAHARGGRYEEAVRTFETVVETAPNDAGYRTNLAAAYRDLVRSGKVVDAERSSGLLERACAQLLDALRIDPDFAPAYHGLGALYRDMEVPWRAREMWTYYLDMAPDGPLAGETRAALDDLDHDEALQRACEEASYLVNHDDPERGLAMLSKVIEDEPEWYDAWFWTGLACRELELLDRGIEAFARACELDPESPFAHHELAALLARKGEREAAEGFWRRAVELADDEPWFLTHLATLLWRDERRDEAEALFAHALEIDPANRKLRLQSRALRAGAPAPPPES